MTHSKRVFSLPLRPPSGSTGHRSRSLVSTPGHLPDIQNPHILTDLVAFVCIVVFVLKLKADNGQSRMTRLMRTILQDGVLYFFVMAVLHIAMMSFTAFAKVIAFLPPTEGRVPTP